jgi:hypothetical protein
MVIVVIDNTKIRHPAGFSYLIPLNHANRALKQVIS